MKMLVTPDFASAESFADVGTLDLPKMLIKISGLTVMIILLLLKLKGIA